jgi:putative ABC transport system permease protein
LAERLKVSNGSDILLTLQSTGGAIKNENFRICGIYHTENNDFDDQMVFVHKKDLQTILNFPPGWASIITVLLNNSDDTKVITNSLQKKYSAIEVQNWMQLSPMIQVLSGTMMQISYIFVGIILIALAFGIINTMLMAVLDRTREIGMLMSIGMPAPKLFGMVMLETIFLSITGSVAGIILGLVSISFFGERGINLSVISEGVNAVGFSSIVHPSLNTGFYVFLALMVIIIAVISGVFPARRAINLNPSEALREE